MNIEIATHILTATKPTRCERDRYACILSHHGGAHGAAQADQGGY